MKLLTLQKISRKLNSLDRFLIILIVISLIVCGVSLFRGIVIDRQVQVEYLNNSVAGDSTSVKVFIDVEGAVMVPGVYELSEGARIKDAIIAAGGLAENADRSFCEKNINMAEEIKDGQKIYIPSRDDTNTEKGYSEANVQDKKISINTASITELDTLWGIGPAKAESIVKNRPYQNLEELVTKGVISKSVLERNIDLLTVY